MIVLELLWAVAIAGAVYYSIQEVIKILEEDRREWRRKAAAEEEAASLREEPPSEPWGTP